MNYKEQFYKYHHLDSCDKLPCVICGAVAVNLHHVNYGKGIKDNNPENLAPMCYDCHTGHHDKNKPSTIEIKAKMLLIYLPF